MAYNWTDKPESIKEWKSNIDYIIFLDENNCDDMTNIIKKISNNLPINNDEKFFTLTGCIISIEDYEILKNDFESLKLSYWKNAQYYNEKKEEYCKICFHSRDIRRSQNAFANTFINTAKFINDLTETIVNINFKIISITINIYEYIMQNNRANLYNTAFNFIIGGLVKLIPDDQKILIVFEARGKREDRLLHKHICSVIQEDGIGDITQEKLAKKIEGVYFNPKWNKKENTTYAGLELTDLCSYPIHKYMRSGIKDLAFHSIENKIMGFPNYMDIGLKKFP